MEVYWQLDGVAMVGTVVRPDGDGPFLSIVMVAGSGPTDRDWCSPLLPGANGIASLFTEAFADAGYASIHDDTRASGLPTMENVPKLSMQSHLDELTATVQTLTALDWVGAATIVGLGNSE